MKTDFEKYGTQMPYKLPEGAMENLKRSIRTRIDSRRTPRRHTTGTVIAQLTVAAVVLICGLVVILGRTVDKSLQPVHTIENLLTEAPYETIEQVAANSYDDIIFNQQI